MLYFKAREFRCNCGCGMGIQNMQPKLLAKLDLARKLAGTVFTVTSAVRCKRQNADAGGREKSSHLDGWAVDIAVVSSRKRFRILHGLIKAGFTRIGIYPTFIHADVDPNKSPEVAWMISKPST